ANEGSDNVTVIDGAGVNPPTNVPVQRQPEAVAVNPVTNYIYVTSTSDNVTVINGANNAAVPIGLGFAPSAIAVNPVTNKIYVTSTGGDTLAAIDGPPDRPLP